MIAIENKVESGETKNGNIIMSVQSITVHLEAQTIHQTVFLIVLIIAVIASFFSEGIGVLILLEYGCFKLMGK